MLEPIIVLCMGRSGSSLTAGILHQHGAWVGECLGADHRNPKGYFENRAIKRALQARSGQKIDRVYPFRPGWRAFVDAEIERQGYHGGPWLVKHNAVFWRVWGEYSPIWVLVRRDKDAVFRSIRKAGFCGWMSDAKLSETIDLHVQEMDYLESLGGVSVDTDAVIKGDDKTLRRAVERCGWHYDPDITRSFINPEHWHQ